MVIRILLIIALSRAVCWGCPKQPDPPCTCRMIAFHSSIITCEGVENDKVLRKSMQSMRDTEIPLKAVQIYDTHVNYLPSDLFKGLKFHKLTIAGSSMVSLSDTDIAFSGLGDSLQILEVQSCILFGGWIWSQLAELKALREFSLMKTGLQEISEDVKDIAHLDIHLLQLTKDSISYIDDTAFATFHNLKTLSLKSNMISRVKRSMFPDPALQLQYILLNDNELESIPSGLFSNMPVLRSIGLADNKLMTVSEAAFSPVWNQLKYINLKDNPLRCDCRMNWLLKLRFPLNTLAQCNEPQKLKGIDIKDLKEKQLWC